jgi:hypothetical protein
MAASATAGRYGRLGVEVALDGGDPQAHQSALLETCANAGP